MPYRDCAHFGHSALKFMACTLNDKGKLSLVSRSCESRPGLPSCAVGMPVLTGKSGGCFSPIVSKTYRVKSVTAAEPKILTHLLDADRFRLRLDNVRLVISTCSCCPLLLSQQRLDRALKHIIRAISGSGVMHVLPSKSFRWPMRVSACLMIPRKQIFDSLETTWCGRTV